MGLELATTCHWQGQSSQGHACLEGDHLLFRGDFRLKLMLADVTGAVTEQGCLSLVTASGTAVFDLGPAAEAWAKRIRNPKSLADKLGIAGGDCVHLIGDAPDPVLIQELNAKGAVIASGSRDAAAFILLSASSPAALDLVPNAAAALAPKGALWIVFPKGKGSPVPQQLVFSAGRGAGLADTKTCAVSAQSTALRFTRRKTA